MHSLSTKIFPKTKRGGAKSGLTYYITYHFNRLTLYGKIYMTYALPRQRGGGGGVPLKTRLVLLGRRREI